MPESTLSLKKQDFESKVGLFFGWGMGPAAGDEEWDARKTAVIRDCVESGYRQFLYPAPQNGVPYDWSFLKPLATMTLISGQDTLTLPDDFGGMEGKMTISGPTTQVWQPIQFVNEGMIREQYLKFPSQTGWPLLAAVRPLKGTTLMAGQRSELFFYPAPDAAYVVQFPYYVLANYLDGSHPYFLGGMPHVETILESCLAIAEQRYDDTSAVHSAKFQERLAASIALDRRFKPQTGGRNTDNSDYSIYRGRDRDAIVTVNGNPV